MKVRNNNGRCLIRFKWAVTGKTLSKTWGDFNDPAQKHVMEGVALKVAQAVTDGSFSGFIDDYMPNSKPRAEVPIIARLERTKPDSTDSVHQTLINKLEKWGKPVETRREAEQFCNAMLGRGSTFNRYLATLSHLHPKLFLQVEKHKANETEPDPFTLIEREQILEALGDSVAERFIEFLMLTGMRDGEIKALEKTDFIESKGSYSIKVSKSLAKGVLKPFPKNKKARSVQLSQPDWMRLRRPFTQGPNPYSKLSLSSVTKRHWKPLLERLGIRYRKKYCMRHTAISKYLAETGDIAATAVMFGTSIKMISKHYGHIVKEIRPL